MIDTNGLLSRIGDGKDIVNGGIDEFGHIHEAFFIDILYIRISLTSLASWNRLNTH